ncbi:MAG: DNA replication/repair protein RecF [Lachnospiraceae bacterium]|nr:DNA replication/repair protein RecF [Lachnospiraceae bacterium]
MYVESVELKNFRNIKELSIRPDPGINIFYGQNAQGKTNILESVCLACTTKSHRGAKDREMIRMGEEESHVRMMLNKHDSQYRIDMHLRKNKKKGAAINGIPAVRAGEIYGLASVVLFSPEDLNIIKNGPSERRRFLDQLISGIDKIYLSDLTNYAKCLTQRGRLLKEFSFREKNMTELSVWDDQLRMYGSRIIQKRIAFIREIEPIVSEIHERLSGGREKLNLVYEPNTEIDMYEDRQIAARDSDLRQKITSVGPHRDDIAIQANQMDLRMFGSQGQQRTAALSMKLAEIRVIENNINDTPILLLDDVLSELDRDRQKYLLQCISNTQTMITCTGLDEFVRNEFTADRTFQVVQGGIT